MTELPGHSIRANMKATNWGTRRNFCGQRLSQEKPHGSVELAGSRKLESLLEMTGMSCGMNKVRTAEVMKTEAAGSMSM